MTGYVADLSWKSGARAIEKFRSTKVDASDFKHELLNRLRSTMAVNVLKYIVVVGSVVWLHILLGLYWCVCVCVCVVCVCVCVCLWCTVQKKKEKKS